MADQGDDVSWAMVTDVVRDWLGSAARLTQLSFLAGGVVNTTLALTTAGGERAVLKIAAHRAVPSLVREGEMLKQLGSLGVPVPTVYATRIATFEWPHTYLLLEQVAGITLRDSRMTCRGPAHDRLQVDLARHVVKLHAVTSDAFGQSGTEQFSTWPAFYRSLVDSLCQAIDKATCLPIKARKTIQKVHDRLDRLLANDDPPRLCHGDLWAGNVLCDVDDHGDCRVTAIIDPDLRYGHAEAEIAYMDLFKTITPAFKQVYQEHFRLSDGYHVVRKPVYQLYCLLNQLQLRGPTFASPVIAAAEKLATIV